MGLSVGQGPTLPGNSGVGLCATKLSEPKIHKKALSEWTTENSLSA